MHECRKLNLKTERIQGIYVTKNGENMTEKSIGYKQLGEWLKRDTEYNVSIYYPSPYVYMTAENKC